MLGFSLKLKIFYLIIIFLQANC